MSPTIDAGGSEGEIPDATVLRERLVEGLRDSGALSDDRVTSAFKAVAREKFLDAALGLAEVYDDAAIVTHRDSHDRPLSSSSQPTMMARMLELLGAQPGERVLEIGTGTGYNAALLSEIVGANGGCVTTIEVDAQIADAARLALERCGYSARVVVGDGAQGWTAAAPYDRIIVTASTGTIPRAWVDQLAVGGRIVFPLRLLADPKAPVLIPAMRNTGQQLESVGVTWGFFMPSHNGDGYNHVTATHANYQPRIIAKVNADQSLALGITWPIE